MAGRESLVRAALEAPDEVRQSRIDLQVLLFYKAEATRRWTRGREAGFGGRVLDHRVSDRRYQGRRSNMADVRILHDREGQTLTVWFTDPSLEHVSEETGDEVVLMKDRSGRVIGFEKLNFLVPESDSVHVALETTRA
jgi:Protein of unknown function (DUF2283)